MSHLPVLSQSRRSTLHLLPDGCVARRYHDTGAWSDPTPLWTSPRARACLARLGDEERTFRGGSTSVPLPPVPLPPAHLRNALSCLCREPTTVSQLAALCEVRTSTAWCYACRVVEAWPASHPLASRLVHPSVLASVRATDDLTGSLRDLSSRLSASSSGGYGTDTRSLPDRYAHLRLARVCVEAERREEEKGKA